jgi:hypothetical protein
MTALHARLAAGQPAPVALAETQQEMRALATFPAAAGFVSIGGERTHPPQ